MMFMTACPQPSRGFEWTQAPWGAALDASRSRRSRHHFFTTALDLAACATTADEWDGGRGRDGCRATTTACCVRQVHGATVAVAARRRGVRGRVPTADAIVSRRSRRRPSPCGWPTACRFCWPTAATGAVAAVHAGWRGTVARRAAAAVRALRASSAVGPEDLVAAIGPCLGPAVTKWATTCSRRSRSRARRATLERWFHAGADRRRPLDLWQRRTRDQLRRHGRAAASISRRRAVHATHARSSFHSYRRRAAAAGRMIGAIGSQISDGSLAGALERPLRFVHARFDSRSASVLCSRRTCSNVDACRAPSTSSRACARAAADPGCLTLYSPRICFTSSSESDRMCSSRCSVLDRPVSAASSRCTRRRCWSRCRARRAARRSACRRPLRCAHRSRPGPGCRGLRRRCSDDHASGRGSGQRLRRGVACAGAPARRRTK